MYKLMAAAQHFFNHHGHQYDRSTRHVFARLHAQALADASRRAPQGGTVLDAGAGPGRLAIALAQRRPDLTVHAVDLSPDMVAVARQHAEEAGVADRVHVTQADIGDLPMPAQSVDLVVSTFSYHHWADVPAGVRELARVLRPDGTIWIYDAWFAPWRRLERALGRRVRRTRLGLLSTRAEVPVARV